MRTRLLVIGILLVAIPIKGSTSGRENDEIALMNCRDIKGLFSIYDQLKQENLVDELPLSYPLLQRGRITSRFGIRNDPLTGKRKTHQGIDIAAPSGTPVYSTANGTVVYAGWRRGYGRCIIIQHRYGFSTLYAHLSAYYTRKDSHIRKGQLIGFVGKTGRSTGYHLHYEIRKKGKAINPLP